MAVNITLTMIPYVDDVLIIVVGMVGDTTHGVDFLIRDDILHISYALYFRDNIGPSMIATLDLLFPYAMSHLGNLSTWKVPLMSSWEEFCYGLPFWRVFHFVWMIAWG